MIKNTEWQFHKEVSLGDVIAFTSALIAVLYSYTTLEKRIALMEAAGIRQNLIDARQDADLNAINADIKRELEKINIKLDKLNGYK
jgi:VIT1/CCC1 family predicted Fe2+/Mn2+ transporter